MRYAIILAGLVFAPGFAWSQPAPDLVPEHRTVSCEKYFPTTKPAEGPEITTFLRVEVPASGHLTNVSMSQSSGDADFDAAAQACASNTKLTPFKLNGEPLDVYFPAEVRWRQRGRSVIILSDGEKTRGCFQAAFPDKKHSAAEGGLSALLTIGEDGTVKNAAITQTSGDEAVDQNYLSCLKERTFSVAMRPDGTATAYDRHIGMKWDTTYSVGARNPAQSESPQ